MYPHRIRLRGPWECEPADGSPPRRLHLPCRWGQTGLTGPARLTRPFGYPGHIDAGERVWLTFIGVSTPAAVTLNGHAIGEARYSAFETEVTALLGPRNRLRVELAPGGQDEPLWDEVTLEIRRTAFLRQVRREPSAGPAASVRGVVVGEAPRPLDLYVLAGGKTVAHQTIGPTPEGEPFRVVIAPGVSPAEPIRVELVDAATVWYAVEVEG
jgi:hypothetical protein